MSDSIHKRKYVRRDWSKIIALWRQSGVSQSAFCSEAKIPIASFSAALARSRESSLLPTPPGFARARLHEQSTCTLQVEIVGGIRISMSGVDPVEFVLQLASRARS